jgi:hypothetical protein
VFIFQTSMKSPSNDSNQNHMSSGEISMKPPCVWGKYEFNPQDGWLYALGSGHPHQASQWQPRRQQHFAATDGRRAFGPGWPLVLMDT